MITEDFIIKNNILTKYDGVEEYAEIPNEVSIIGRYAFEESNYPSEIVIPESVHTIELLAFYFCLVKKVSLPDSLLKIDTRAFACCNELKKITIPRNVHELGQYVFMGCNSLEEINVHPDNEIYYSEKGALFQRKKDEIILICVPGGKTGTYHVPDGTTIIEDYSFYGCNKINEVFLPESVKEIKQGALCGLKSSCVIHLPKMFSETNLEQYKQYKKYNDPRNEKTTNNYYPKKNNVLKNAEEIIEADNKYKKHNYQKDGMEICIRDEKVSVTSCDRDVAGIVIVPDGVTHISDAAFSYHDKIEEVILPDSLVVIGEYAFENCINLKKIHIPDSVTDIGNYAFSGCEKLYEIVALNMLDPYPYNIRCAFDIICPNKTRKSNRRQVFEDDVFIIPTAFPKIRLNSGYDRNWKLALTLGFLDHLELYSSYDHNKDGNVYRGVSFYEDDLPYAKYALDHKKDMLDFIFHEDRPEMLRFYALQGKITKKNYKRSFLEPAQKYGASGCIAYINDWIAGDLKIEPIIPRVNTINNLKGSISSDEALEKWAYEICYLPSPTVCLTGLKASGKDINVLIPEYIDNIPVGILDMYVFMGYIFEKYSLIKSITFGSNIRKILCDIPKTIKIKAPKGCYARKFALKNKCDFEEINYLNIYS